MGNVTTITFECPNLIVEEICCHCAVSHDITETYLVPPEWHILVKNMWSDSGCAEVPYQGRRLPHTQGPKNPEGPNLEKIQDRPPGLKFSSEIETNDIFKRDWKFQASHPPNPYFCGEFSRSRLKVSSEIEVFKRDWKFQAKTWNFQAFKRDWFFSRFGPSGNAKKIVLKTVLGTRPEGPKARLRQGTFEKPKFPQKHAINYISDCRAN